MLRLLVFKVFFTISVYYVIYNVVTIIARTFFAKHGIADS